MPKGQISRREFLGAVGGGVAWAVLGPRGLAAPGARARPNIILVVADDLGWRDMGYSGNPVIKTPALDAMAAGGVRFSYFYSGGQMCSPGRYAILTGRSPLRCGIYALQNIRPEEVILPRALKTAGYRAAHFGKWHLGSGKMSPVGMGYDQARWTPNYFDLDTKFRIDDTNDFVETKGESSLAVMDLALEYVRQRAKEPQPFLMAVCFGSPHSPHQPAPEFAALYPGEPENRRNFLGEVSGLDAAVGKLRAELRTLGIADNTLIWFTSDNGGITKESMDPAGKGKGNVGVRTAAVLEWPARFKQPVHVSMPCAHMDMYPTLLDIAGVQHPGPAPLDGISILPAMDGRMQQRPKPMGFMLYRPRGRAEGEGKAAAQAKADTTAKAKPKARGGGIAQADFIADFQGVWIDGNHKLVVSPAAGEDKPATITLYDIFADPAEKTNLADGKPEVVERLRKALEDWQRSVRASYDGKDFPGARTGQ